MENKNLTIIINNENYKTNIIETKKYWNKKTENKHIFNKSIFKNFFKKKKLINKKINLINQYSLVEKEKNSIDDQTKKQAFLLKKLLLEIKDLKSNIFMKSEIFNKKRTLELFKSIKNNNSDKILIISTAYSQNHEDFIVKSNDVKNLCKSINLKADIKYLVPFSSSDNYVKAVIDKIMEDIIDIQNIEDYKLIFAISQPAQRVDRNNFIHVDYLIDIIKKVMIVLCNILGFIIEYQICYYRDNLFDANEFETNVVNSIQITANEGKNIVMVPISFVYESPETVVDFDIKYRQCALDFGVSDYILTKPIYDNPYFIKWLFEEVKKFID